ncbi:MAG: porin [Rhodocyclaceae bacterium]|nr:porin [Rhodocyclaceae bacterium]
MFKARTLALACAAVFAGQSGLALAESKTDQMKAQIDALQRQIDSMKSSLSDVKTEQSSQQASLNKVSAAQAKQAESPSVSMVPGDDLIFQVGKARVQIYGHVDVSLDSMTNGLSGAVGAKGSNGWMGDVSSNLSFFGMRGSRPLTDDLSGVFQFESEVAYASTPGTSDKAPDTAAQKFGLGGRNSFVGLQSKAAGAVKLGKTDTPYKLSTARLDPFASTVGDYNSIMGNTGGDTRTEFDARMSHSIWYESPKFNGVQVSALYSPGQNRSTDGLRYPMGEPSCAGGNTGDCGDGAWKDAYSLAATYDNGSLYATAAYEMHKNVNRSGDDNAPGSVGIANEDAWKLGAQYKFTSRTILNAVFEKLKRSAITTAEDERSRNGTWLALTQYITDKDALNFGWAHAGRTPGQPVSGLVLMNGQAAPVGASDNAANMFDIGYKHWFDKKTTVYAVYSQLNNGTNAHYALGPGGHGIATRNQDGDGNVFEGNRVKAFSVGMTYDF